MHPLSIRKNVAACAAVVVLICAASFDRVAAEPLPSLRTTPLAEDLYLVTGPGFVANVVFLVTAEGVLVVDSGDSPAYGRAVVEEIRKTTDQSIRYLVLTHYHRDHTFGASAFPTSTRILTHPRLAANVEGLRNRWMALYPAELARLGEHVENLKKAAGVDLAAAQAQLSTAEDEFAMLKALPPLKPEIGLDDRLTLRLGRHAVDVMFPGPTHTNDAVYVVFRDLGIAHVNDFVLPHIHPWLRSEDGASTANWVKVLQAAQSWESMTIVPGHGNPGSKDLFRQQLRYLEALRGQIQKGIEDGADAAAVQDRVTMAEFVDYQWPAGIPRTVATVYQELRSGGK